MSITFLKLKKRIGVKNDRVVQSVFFSSNERNGDVSHSNEIYREQWKQQKNGEAKTANMEKKNRALADREIEFVDGEIEDNSLQAQLKRLQKKRFTGRVDIDIQGQTWKLYLSLGRLAWASGGIHEQRRWQRQLIRANVAREITTRQNDRSECWDYRLLHALFIKKLINKKQQIAIVRGVVTEILFEIRQAIAIASIAQSKVQNQEESDNRVALILHAGIRPDDTGILPRKWTLEVELAWIMVEKVWEAWEKSGLTRCSPNFAPILKNTDILEEQVPLKTYYALVKLANGMRTLRDIAILVKKDLLGLTKYLLPYFRNKAIAVVAVEDSRESLLIFCQKRESLKSHQLERQNRGLILCVDDSETIRRGMESWLRDAGYRVITVGEAVQAIPTLLQCQPDAIFLDLMMPIANGYEICTQIRRIAQFKNTPVIFLTGNNGLVDRMRAKIVGATDFLSKPVDRDRILATVEKYVQNTN